MVMSNLHEWGPQFNTSVRLPKTAFLPNLLKSLEVSQIYITKSWTVKLLHFEFKYKASHRIQGERMKLNSQKLAKKVLKNCIISSCITPLALRQM